MYADDIGTERDTRGHGGVEVWIRVNLKDWNHVRQNAFPL